MPSWTRSIHLQSTAYPVWLRTALCHKQPLERYIKQLLYFQLSYDGTEDEQRHFKVVASSPRDQVVKTIRRILEAQLPVFLRATIHAGNVGKMTEVVKFASEVGAQAVSFAPICDEGNAAARSVPRPRISDYVENFFAAFDLAKQANVGFYSAEVHTVSANAQQFYPPLVVLPDGYVCFSIKVASSSAPNAGQVIAGKFNLNDAHLTLEWYEDLVRERINNFAGNQQRHCFNCSAYRGCKGKRAFDTFCSTPDLTEYDDYYCEITRRIFGGLMRYNLNSYRIF